MKFTVSRNFLIATLLTLAGIVVGQNLYNGGAGILNQGPITYGRNIVISTTNDSQALTIQKPTGITNNLFSVLEGSQHVYDVNSNGAIVNLGSNAASQTLTALGIEYGVTTTNNVTFPTPFLVPPTVTITPTNFSSGSFVEVTNVTTTNFQTDQFGGVTPTNQLNWLAVGAPNSGH